MTTEAKRAAQARYREKNRAKIAADQRVRAAALKLDVFSHYGMACAECGFDDLRALSIDHIDNDGAIERNTKPEGYRFAGHIMYRDLKKRGFPDGYQTLCMNCNFIKHAEYNVTKYAPIV